MQTNLEKCANVEQKSLSGIKQLDKEIPSQLSSDNS